MALSENTFGYELDVGYDIAQLFAKSLIRDYDNEDLLDMIEHADNGDLIFDNLVRNGVEQNLEAISDDIYDIIYDFLPYELTSKMN